MMRQAMYLLFYPFFSKELATALGTLGRLDDAIDEIGKAQQVADETGYRWFVPEILRTKGELLMRRGPDEAAVVEALFRQAAREAGMRGGIYWELSASTGFADFLEGQGKLAEALLTLEICIPSIARAGRRRQNLASQDVAGSIDRPEHPLNNCPHDANQKHLCGACFPCPEALAIVAG